MATTRELQVVLSAKNNASASLKRFSDDMKGVNAGAIDITRGLKVAGTAITGFSVALGGMAVKAAVGFEKGISNVSTLLDTTVENMDDMKQELLDMASEMPVALDDLTSALYDVRSAGIAAGDAMDVLNTSAKLGVAGLGTTKEATTLVTLAMNNFRDSELSATEMANVMFKTVKAGITTVADLSQSFGKVAPLAVGAGVSFEELQAVTAALTQVNKSASMSQNAVAQSLISLGKPSKEAIELFGKGVDTFTELIDKSGGYVNALKAMKDASKGNEIMFAKAIGSGEALSAVNSLLGAQYEVVQGTMSDMTNGVDNLTEAYDKQKGTMDAQFTILKNNLNIALIELGTVILPMLMPLVKGLTKLFKGMNPTVLAIGIAIGLVIGPLLLLIGFLPGIVAGFTLLGPVLVAVGGAFAAITLPMVLIAAGIVALGVAVYLLIKHWDKVKEVTGAVWDWMKDKISVTIDFMKGVISGFIDFWNMIWNGLVMATKVALAVLVGAFVMFMDWLFPNWQEGIKNLIDAWKTAWDFIYNIAVSAITAVGGFIAGIFAWFQSLVTHLGGILVAWLTPVKDAWNYVWGGIKTFFISVWDAIKSVVSSSVGYVLGKLQKVIDLYDKVKGIIAKPLKAATGAVSSFFSSAYAKGKGILGFAGGGVVPGPIGAAVPAIVHGGEMITPANGNGEGSGNTYNFNFSGAMIGDKYALIEMIKKSIARDNELTFLGVK